MAELFAEDLANVESGLYPLPRDNDGPFARIVQRSRLFFQDVPKVYARRMSGNYTQVPVGGVAGKFPDYYLRNFHFQSGGWLTDESAQLYDTQVEVLFNGAANAMRRQVLPPLRECFTGRDQRKLRLLDVACGTARFLHFAKQTWPRMPMVGIDLSEAYLKEARRQLKRWSKLSFVLGNAECLGSVRQDGVILRVT